MKIPITIVEATVKGSPSRSYIGSAHFASARFTFSISECPNGADCFRPALAAHPTGAHHPSPILHAKPRFDYNSPAKDGSHRYQRGFIGFALIYLRLIAATGLISAASKAVAIANRLNATLTTHPTGTISILSTTEIQTVFDHHKIADLGTNGNEGMFQISLRRRYTPTWLRQVVHLALHGYLELCCTANSISTRDLCGSAL
jgi:hypothetical protein